MKTYSRYNTRYSKDTLRLSEPEMNMKTMGDRAFRAYGPVQRNKLPLSLRSVEIKDSKTIRQVETFKTDLATHLFKQKQYFKSEKKHHRQAELLLTEYCFLGLWNCVYLIQQFVCKAHRDVCLMRHIRMNLLLLWDVANLKPYPLLHQTFFWLKILVISSYQNKLSPVFDSPNSLGSEINEINREW